MKNNLIISLVVILSVTASALFSYLNGQAQQEKVMGGTEIANTWEQIYNSDVYKAIQAQNTQTAIDSMNKLVADAQKAQASGTIAK